MKVKEFLKNVCDEQGPSQVLAGDIIEGMSPVSFAALIAEIAMQQRLIDSLKKASRKIIAQSRAGQTEPAEIFA